MAKNFKHDLWDFDCYGEAYIIAIDECPLAENVPDFICTNYQISERFKSEMVVENGWCKYQVRTDWENGDGTPSGGYVVEKIPPKNIQGKIKSGWFPVWIVRNGEWD